MLSGEEKLEKQLNKIDSNKKDGLEKEEIDRFLLNERKVKRLGNIMQEAYGDESEKLQEYKENVGKICERILKNDNINLNQGKILFFYLKHFHNEDVGIGHDIIKTVIDGSKGNRYEEVTSNVLNPKEGQNQDIDNRFNNLPGAKEIKEAWENSEKCNQLLESIDLSLEDIQWLNEYKETGDLDPSIVDKIDEKVQIENLKRCEKLIDSVDVLSEYDIQWLNEYKESLDKDSRQELINRIEERLKLEGLDQDILGEVYSEIYSNPLSNIENICSGLGKTTPNWNVITENINLDDTEGLDLTSIEEKVTTSVTEENISQYLQLPEGVSEENKYYITNNFKNILIKYLGLHSGYKASWGLKPNENVTGISLESMVEENNLLESAYKKLDELNNRGDLPFDKLNPQQKNQKLEEILNENNHILFDLRLKTVLTSCNPQKIGDVVAYIMNYCNKKYPLILKEFIKNNSFINSVYQEYNKAKREAEAEKRRQEEMKRINEEVDKYVKQAEKVIIPENVRNNFEGAKSFIIFSRRQIADFKSYYDEVKVKKGDNKSYDYFCKLYESSKVFYEAEGVKSLGLPDCLRAQDYIDFMGDLVTMESDIGKLEKETENLRCKGGMVPGYIGAVDAGISSHYMKKAKVCNIQAARKFVELRKKVPGKKPDNFLGIKLNRRYSNGNPNDKTDIDKIIRDTTLEGLRDKASTFGRTATGERCCQSIVGDVVGLGVGLVLSTATTVYTGNAALGGAAYYLGSKLGNGGAQVVWDLAVDGLCGKVLGLREESGNNRYDGPNASAGLGIGLYKRDENGNVIQEKSTGEWLIDTAFGTMATAATFGITSKLGITIKESPFKYASIDEFINKPLSNTLAAATKSAIGTVNYEGISVSDAMKTQIREEYGGAGIAKKILNIALVTGMVKLGNKRCKKDSDILGKISSKFERLESILKGRGYNVNDIQKMTEGEIKNFMKQGFGGLVDDLAQEVQKGWKAFAVPIIPLAMNGLLCSYESPKDVLRRKVKSILNKKKEASTTPEEIERYNKLLERYRKLEDYITNDMPNMDADTGEMIEFMKSKGLGDLQEEPDTQPGSVEFEEPGNQNDGGNYELNNESACGPNEEKYITDGHSYTIDSISQSKTIHSNTSDIRGDNVDNEQKNSEIDAVIGQTKSDLNDLKSEILGWNTPEGAAGSEKINAMVNGILGKYNKKGKQDRLNN